MLLQVEATETRSKLKKKKVAQDTSFTVKTLYRYNYAPFRDDYRNIPIYIDISALFASCSGDLDVCISKTLP